MPVFWQDLGDLSGDTAADIRRIANYIATIQEQVEFSNNNIQRRLSALEEKAGVKNGSEKV